MAPMSEFEELRVMVMETSFSLKSHVDHCEELHLDYKDQMREQKKTQAILFHKIDDLNNTIASYMLGVIALLLAIVGTMIYSGLPWDR